MLQQGPFARPACGAAPRHVAALPQGAGALNLHPSPQMWLSFCRYQTRSASARMLRAATAEAHEACTACHTPSQATQPRSPLRISGSSSWVLFAVTFFMSLASGDATGASYAQAVSPPSSRATETVAAAPSSLVSGRVFVPPHLLSGVRISVNGDLLSLSPSSSGDFVLPRLPVGSYVVQPSHPLLAFPSYLLTVSSASESLAAAPAGDQAASAPKASVYLLGESFRPLTPEAPLPLPLRVLPTSGPPAYFVVKPPFSLLFLLQQPLLLVAAACFGLMWCLPKLQKYQEEEERRQNLIAQQHQQALHGARGGGHEGATAVARRSGASGGASANLYADRTAVEGGRGAGDEDCSAFLRGLTTLREDRRAVRH
ncbi:hypothetical protein BESB_046580 [Besnoitia besnoiti]|uniref:ER membrane protein complex subunit 7 beta-sandwich domain-containing protein n=1 Tax=Besnoitia besnoiti TaxID=94643 RepID=A0A2A9MKF6_BESBE|nr:hypothetical protein BESB_046580 [Besnoitia besnoiti]PFH36466.1 hypothetical protein BESB_046580 [Besnoitia besnoiti]